MSTKEFREIVEDYCGLDISSKSKITHYVFYRRCYYYLCYKYLPKIIDHVVTKEIDQDRLSLMHGLKKLDLILNWEKDKQSIKILTEIENIVNKKYEYTNTIFNNYNHFDKINLLRYQEKLKKSIERYGRQLSKTKHELKLLRSQ